MRLQYLPLPFIAFSDETTNTGALHTRLAAQTKAIILQAWNCVCHRLDLSGLQIAKYRSKDIATKVHTPTDTDTAEKDYYTLSLYYRIKQIIIAVAGLCWYSNKGSVNYPQTVVIKSAIEALRDKTNQFIPFILMLLVFRTIKST